MMLYLDSTPLRRSNLVIKIMLLLMLSATYYSSAQCDRPEICNRACWSPNNEQPAQTSPTTTTPTHIIVHHTGDDSVFPNDTDYKEIIRYYWDLHVNTNGWADIGYNWLIDRNGVIYEGRGDGVLGAHFSCMSSNTMGVALIGNFELETPSSAALDALKTLIAWEATDKDINITGNSLHNSSQLNLNTISGHRDGNTSNSSSSCASGTVCPGESLYNAFSDLRDDISNLSCYSSPDVVIQTMWTEPSNPSNGNSVDLYVTIKNVGTKVANDISLDYKINSNTIGSNTHASLTPDETTTLVYNDYVFETFGDFNYCVYIDAVEGEQNTLNNSYCIDITIEDTLSAEQIAFQKQVSVYPNPIIDRLYIASTTTSISELTIYDLNGSIVKTVSQNNIKELDISELNSGIYVLTLISNTNKTAVFKIVKK